MSNFKPHREYLHHMAQDFSENNLNVGLREKRSKLTDFSIARILEFPTSCTPNVTNPSRAQVQPEARNSSPEMPSNSLSSWELMSEFDDSAVEFWNLPEQLMSARTNESILIQYANLTAATTSSTTLNASPIASAPSINFTGVPPGVSPAHLENQEDSDSSFGNVTTESSSSSCGDTSSSPCHWDDPSSDFFSSDMHGPVNFAVVLPQNSHCFDNVSDDDSLVSLEEAIFDLCRDLAATNSQIDGIKSQEKPSSCEMEPSKVSFESSPTDQIVLNELEDTSACLQTPLDGSSDVSSLLSNDCNSIDCKPSETSREPPIAFLKEITKELAEYALHDLNITRRQIKVTKKKRVRFARGTKFTSSKSKKTSHKKHDTTDSNNRRATLRPRTLLQAEKFCIELD